MFICDECLEKYYENEKLSKQDIWECNVCRKYTMCNQIFIRNLVQKEEVNGKNEMNKKEDITILIRMVERIFGINESDPDEAIRFKEFRKVLEYFKIEALRSK